jgi:isochorismate synthase
MNEMHEALKRARTAAQRSGRPHVVARAEPLDTADLLQVFAAAETARLPRFAALRPALGHIRIGIGLAGPPIEACVTGCSAADVRSLWTEADLDPISREQLAVVGGLAFEPRASQARDPEWREFGDGRLALPALSLIECGGQAWLIRAAQVRANDDPEQIARALERLHARAVQTPQARKRAPLLHGPPPEGLGDRYARAAAEVIGAIRGGAARKVVIADVEKLETEGVLPARPVLERLAQMHPGCLVFAQGLGDVTFLGATPELMVGLQEGHVRASALAGTAPRGDRALLESRKDLDEHAFVVEAITGTLRSCCSEVEVPAQPVLIETGNVMHLHTPITAVAQRGTHLLDLVEALHPTPAVAGTPRPAALELIRKHEPFDRGWYAGPIGWVNARGEGEMYVALRCGLVQPGEVRLYAGAGLVAASDPQREAAETRLKLGALRAPLEAACAQ